MATRKEHSQTALITGATSNIGYELAKYFAKKGNNLVLVARDQHVLYKICDEIEDEFGIYASALTLDFALPTSPNEIFSELTRASIQVDILVNNPEFDNSGLINKTSLEYELKTTQANLVNLTHLTKFLLPSMLKHKFGKILNIMTAGSFTPDPSNAVYCVTKEYIQSFSEALENELKSTNINVMVLCPDEDFFKKTNILTKIRKFSINR